MLKHILRIFCITLCSCLIYGNPTSNTTYSLELHITNIPEGNGLVFLALHNEQTFLKENPVKSFKLNPEGKKNISLTINELKQDNYAVTMFYDKNNNNKLDFFLMFPKEPAAFSNNYKPKGPPNFKKSMFTINEKLTTQTISF